jgi:hypothetical protein
MVPHVDLRNQPHTLERPMLPVASLALKAVALAMGAAAVVMAGIG